MSADTLRRRELARIHCARKDLGLDDETYRGVLRTLADVSSAKDLDAAGRTKVIEHLNRLSPRPPVKEHPGKPTNAKVHPEIEKIEAFLAEAKRPWSYADGIAKRMYGVERVQFLDGSQLRSLIAALHRDAQRHDRRTR